MPPKPFDKYDIGGAYHWKWYAINYEGYRDFVDMLAGLLPRTGRVLDVGCGDGLMSFVMFLRGLATVGIDTHALAIGLADRISMDAALGRHDSMLSEPVGPAFRQRYKAGELEYRCQSVYDLDERDSFDVALCIEVFEHLERPRVALDKLHDAIRSYAIITTPDGALEEPGPYDHQLWTRDSFADFLQGYRFEFIGLRAGTLAVVLHKTKGA